MENLDILYLKKEINNLYDLMFEINFSLTFKIILYTAIPWVIWYFYHYIKSKYSYRLHNIIELDDSLLSCKSTKKSLADDKKSLADDKKSLADDKKSLADSVKARGLSNPLGCKRIVIVPLLKTRVPHCYQQAKVPLDYQKDRFNKVESDQKDRFNKVESDDKNAKAPQADKKINNPELQQDKPPSLICMESDSTLLNQSSGSNKGETTSPTKVTQNINLLEEFVDFYSNSITPVSQMCTHKCACYK
jgi:hypothetical protein